jgi:hypothetical protein
LQVGAFFGNDRAFDGANLQADATVDAGGKVDPIPVGSFGVFTGTGMDAGNGASVYAVGNAFANVGHNRMWHGVLL